MASSLTTSILPLTLIRPPPRLPSRRRYNHRPAITTTCKAKDADTDTNTSGGGIELAAAIGGMVSNPVIGWSLYTLKTTGCGLPPGPGGSVGALEGVSYLAVAAIVGWSLYTKAKTGTGLPSGPFGVLGAVEGVSYLTLLAVVVVFGLQFFERGYIPGPLPADQCFG